MSELTEGKKAPAFSMKASGGREVSSAALKGRPYLLYFYPKANTPGCTKQACDFRDSYASLKKQGAAVLGVSKDSAASHDKFKAKYKLPFGLLSDPDRKVMTRYGAFGEKMMYGKKVEGVIRSTVWIGPDGKVRKHWARVAKAEAHPAQVLDAIRTGD